MNNKAQRMWEEYERYFKDIPEVYNPNASCFNGDNIEYLINCSCDRYYRIYGRNNTTLPLSEEAKDVHCPYCNRSIDERISHSIHSGGCFNAIFIHAPDLEKIKKIRYEQ